MKFNIRREGFRFILPLLVFSLAISMGALFYRALFLFLPALICWAALFFVAFFFRDPKRKTPSLPNQIISPADGKILKISEVFESQYLKQDVIKISIFMSVFDVHVNRAPIKGKIEYFHYHPGKFFSAFKEKASLANEQISLGIVAPGSNADSGNYRLMIKLIAGLIARRIVTWKGLESQVNRGERIGMIKFGSRVEIFLPEKVKISIREGDRVKAGETVVGWIEQ